MLVTKCRYLAYGGVCVHVNSSLIFLRIHLWSYLQLWKSVYISVSHVTNNMFCQYSFCTNEVLWVWRMVQMPRCWQWGALGQWGVMRCRGCPVPAPAAPPQGTARPCSQDGSALGAESDGQERNRRDKKWWILEATPRSEEEVDEVVLHGGAEIYTTVCGGGKFTLEGCTTWKGPTMEQGKVCGGKGCREELWVTDHSPHSPTLKEVEGADESISKPIFN